MLINAAHVQHMKNTVPTLGDRNFPHAAVPVTSKFQELFEATTYIKIWFLPHREQCFMSIMRTNAV
jgi:hypothetical protein